MKIIKDKYNAIAKEAGSFKQFVFEKWSVAIALVVALAVKNLVTALVENILTPIMAFILRGKSIYEMSYNLTSTSSIKYGQFLQELSTFLLLMLLVFIASKFLNRKVEAEAASK